MQMIKKIKIWCGILSAAAVFVPSLYSLELKPRDKTDVASGASRDIQVWCPGGIGGRWLAVGQPNYCNRHDKVIFRFSLRSIKKPVARAVLRYRQSADKRNAEVEELVIEHFKVEQKKLTNAVLNDKNTIRIARYQVHPGKAAETIVDVTALIQEDIRRGYGYSTFRVFSLIAEKRAPKNKLVNCVSINKASISLEVLDKEELAGLGVILSPEGKPYQGIEVDPGASELACYAARELQEHLYKITGSRLPIYAPGAAPALPVIAVGRNAVKKRTGFDSYKLAPEGFRIFTQKDVLAIAGKDHEGKPVLLDGADGRLFAYSFSHRIAGNAALGVYLFGNAGSLYGVYRFLEQYAGVRWYMPGPDGCVIPRKKKLQIPGIRIAYAPPVNYRYPSSNMRGDVMQWIRRIRGGGTAPLLTAHSYRHMLRYKNTHPEYFALDRSGKRVFTNACTIERNGHLCLTNPKTADAFAGIVIEIFKKDPDLKHFPVMPGDGLFAVCSCPNCQAELTPEIPEGRFSKHVWGFVNKVARKVAKVFPDRIITCCAYEEYRNPPADLKLEPNVAVTVCYHRYRMHNPVYAEQNRRIIDAWSKKTKHLYTWNYYLEFLKVYSGLMPGSPRLYEQDYRRLFSSGVWRGEFMEAGYHGHMRDLETRHILIYISCRLMWDPKANVNALLNEYYRLFYGPAEKEMRKYFETIFTAFEQKRNGGTKDHPPVPEYIYSPDVIKTLESSLAAAVKAAPAGSVYRRRINMIRKAFLPAIAKLKMFVSEGNPSITAYKIKNENEIVKIVPSCFVGRDGEIPEHRTWIATGYDTKRLYLRFYCHEDQMKKLKADYFASNDDMKMWQDDTVEAFISPNVSNPDTSFQFAVNPNGRYWDAKLQFGHTITGKWNSKGFKTKITRQKKRWIVDMSILFSDLGITPAPGKQMKVNFIRNRVTGGKGIRSSCFAPLFAPVNFTPDRFGTLSLEK